MKAPFVAATLLGNALLAALLISRPAMVPPAVRDVFARGEMRRSSPPAAWRADTSPAPNRAVPSAAPSGWEQLHADDLPTYVARLRAAGFPASVIRAIVSAEVAAVYDKRIQAIMEPDPGAPFWKARSSWMMFGDKRIEELGQLQRERSRVLRDLLRDDFFASEEVTAAQRRQYGALTRSQIDAVQRIEDDYNEMIGAVRTASQGVMLPEDRAKLALLEKEKRTDLLGVLSPDELANYELRNSPTSNLVRNQLRGFDATEAEFRAIYQAQLALNERFPGSFASIDSETRQAAITTYQDQLRASLGETRFKEFLRESSTEYQQLSRITDREKLPREVATRVYDLREAMATESNRIYDDTSLTVDDKRAALLNLAQTTRSQLLAALGPAAGPDYVKIADSWLNVVQQGSAVSFARSHPMQIVTGQGTIGFSTGPDYRRLPGARPQPAR